MCGDTTRTIISDFLRLPDRVCHPDPRQESFAVLSETGVRQKRIQDQYDHVAGIVLHSGVPHGIRVQFETAKNLYLYSWFVYRFYPVSQAHAYACLELALRIRLAPRDKKSSPPQGLRSLLKSAIKNGLLQNERFSAWQQKTRLNAEMRMLFERLAEMSEDELGSAETETQIKDIDCDHDYLP